VNLFDVLSSLAQELIKGASRKMYKFLENILPDFVVYLKIFVHGVGEVECI
jgi:hypothetical protein